MLRLFKTKVPTSFAFFSTNIRFQSSTTKPINTTQPENDDFVADSAFLNLMDENEQQQISNSFSSSSSSSSTLVPVQPLGIERLPHHPDGTKFSRLNNIVTSKPAPNVPTQRKASEEEPQMEEITSLLAREEDIQKMGQEGMSMSDAQQKLGTAGSAGSNNGNSQYHTEGNEEVLDENATVEDELPYDDAAFAETILKMEVEGAIDETWQDTVQAKPEDVKEIVDVLRDARARDVVAIDVRSKTSNFDFILVATCESQRHMTLVSWSVSEADKWNRITKPSRRKADELWDVVPVGRILVNLMIESYRNEVTVERKWAVTKSMDPLDAAHTRVSESRQTRMHGLWSLTMNLQDLEDFEIDYCKDVLMSQL